MDGAVVDRDHEIHRRDLSGERVEELRGIDLAVPMHEVPGLAPQRFKVATDVAVLQRDESAVRRLEDRTPEVQVDGADRGAVAIAATPGDSDQALAREHRPVAVAQL